MSYQFRENGNHYNGGAVFFGYGFTAIGEPRLEMVRRWYRQGKQRGQTEDHFYVDGTQVSDYANAVDALKSPPVFSDEEIAALKTVGDAFGRYRTSENVMAFMYLGKKGAIEWRQGQCRLTESGRAAIAKATNIDQQAAEPRNVKPIP